MFDKSVKTTQWIKKYFQQMIPGQLDIYMQKNEVKSLPHTTYKTNSKWTEGVNVSTEVIKCLEENMGVNLCNFGLGVAL